MHALQAAGEGKQHCVAECALPPANSQIQRERIRPLDLSFARHPSVAIPLRTLFERSASGCGFYEFRLCERGHSSESNQKEEEPISDYLISARRCNRDQKEIDFSQNSPTCLTPISAVARNATYNSDGDCHARNSQDTTICVRVVLLSESVAG